MLASAATKMVPFNPSVGATTVRACESIGRHHVSCDMVGLLARDSTHLVDASCYSAYFSGNGENGPVEAVAHPGYRVKHPFTMLRYVLVGVLVEIVDRDPKQLDALPVELWKVLCGWFFRYPHNNLYHGVFYKLVFKALRSNSVGALRMAVSRGRLIAQLVDSHIGGNKVSSCRPIARNDRAIESQCPQRSCGSLLLY